MGKLSDENIIKNGYRIDKAVLLFTNNKDHVEVCDGCDELAPCACIRTLNNDTVHLCKSCIQETLDSFN